MTDLSKKGASSPPPQSGPRRIIVYSGADPKKSQSSLFFLHLFWAVILQGRERGYEMIPVMDTRPEFNRDSAAPQEVLEAQAHGVIDGVIAIMIYESMTDWIKVSGIPYAILGSSQKDRSPHFEYEKIVAESISRFAELGCKTMGIMMPSDIANSSVMETIDEKAEDHGICINYEWIIVSRGAMETKGYQQFQSLWDLKRHPDGLMIFPDVTARGVVSAIVERRVRVPEQLKLILHRNVEAPYTVPFSCDWFELSVEPVAKCLLGILDKQWAGLPAPLVPIDFKLVKVL